MQSMSAKEKQVPYGNPSLSAIERATARRNFRYTSDLRFWETGEFPLGRLEYTTVYIYKSFGFPHYYYYLFL